MKNKKKSIFTKKQIIIMVIVAVLFFILILAIALNPTGRKSIPNKKSEVDLDKELETIEDVVLYYESQFYGVSNSQEEGYDLDISVGFKYNLFEEEQSKESFFKDFYEKIAMVTNFKSFRLIDQSKDITIAVKCNNGKISEVLINGVKDYYKKESSNKSRENSLNVEEIKVTINSKELNDLIEASWIINNVDLGTVDSTCNKYDIYFDEGYEIRTIQGRVYNIVFKPKYNNPVIEDFKPGVKLDRVKAALGESYTDYDFMGYKTKDFYIYFSENEISVYPNRRYDYTEFENLVKEYDEKENINEFMDKLTDIWPDYDKYEYDSSYFEIWYTLKGVKIHYNSINPEGIQIYENYKGNLKNEVKALRDVYYKLNQNLIIEKEQTRIMTTTVYDNSGIAEDPIHYSNKFYFMPGSTFQSSRVIAIDNKYPSSDIDIIGEIYSYVWLDDTHLLFSIRSRGMYIFNAENRTLSTLVEDENSQFEITNFDRSTNILEYDGTRVQIDF